MPFGTAIPPKKFELLRCLNTFRHDAHVQTSAHTDHGTDDTRIASTCEQLARRLILRNSMPSIPMLSGETPLRVPLKDTFSAAFACDPITMGELNPPGRR